MVFQAILGSLGKIIHLPKYVKTGFFINVLEDFTKLEIIIIIRKTFDLTELH